MGWAVRFDPRAQRELEKLDRAAQARILKFLRERVKSGSNPRESGKPLAGEMAGLWRYRVGDYRLVCHLRDQDLVVLVVRVGHRREVYR